MYLKSIEIVGFKSFADRTRVELKPGITGVIGPNGCGKSNIMEAIRWCIGEMSWKSLRSESMVSVIFAGTARRSPMNLSEVTLTFDNAQSMLPVQYSEVQVMRRLFRSGESEYWLNKTQCRLRDVRELFLDTGIGNDGYAIIDQGQVDFMVKSKPEERRALFEEAAGVAKYKAKRTEALRKLDRVEIDLGRLKDSLSLLNEQIKKLDDSARKAQLFKKYKEELGALEAGSILKEVGQLDVSLGEERARLTPLAVQLAELKTALGGDEARLAALNLERSAQNGQIVDANNRIGEAKAAVTVLEERVKNADASTADLTAQLEAGGKQLEADALRAEAMEPVIAQARAAHEEAAERATRAGEDLARFTAEFEALAAERDALQRALDEVRRAVTAAVAAAVEAGNRVSSIDSRSNRGQASLEGTLRETEKAATRHQAFTAEAAELAAASAAAAADSAAAGAACDEAEAASASAAAELEALGRRVFELRTEEAGVTAHVKALVGQGSRDPYWVGSQTITAAGIPGVLGTVRSLIEYEDSARREVEDALGERLYAVVCADRAAAATAVELLKGVGAGRARLLVQSQVPSGAPAGALKGRVRYAPELESVVAHLLAGAGDEGAAWLYGGAVGAEAPAAGLADVEGLKARRASLAADLVVVSDRRAALEGERAARDEAVKAARQRVSETDRKSDALAGRLKHAENMVAQYQEELSGLAAQEERLRADLAGLAEERAASEAAAQTARDAEAERRADEARALAGAQEVSERLAVRRSEKETIERSVEGLRRSEVFSRQQLGGLVAGRESLEAGNAARREQHAAWEARLGSLAGEKAESLERIDGLRRDLSALENEAAALHERVQKTELDAAALSAALHERKAAVEALQDDLHKGEMALATADARRASLVQRLSEEWQLGYEDAKSKYPEAEADPERLEFLRRRIAALGNINMAAPEEYEELSKRRDGLQAQVDDLNQAALDLRNVVSKINATTRENFRQTFSEVREHFRKLYAVLFEGGEADLILTDAENLLDTGVEIVAQPPGKKLQNLSQLSGGEKTLTAIALLFAFFMVKPSPICMLDEADAALDDANVDRFVSMLREFGGRTQFLIVSHNKKTMEACDAIYGVTMEESGVTQLVSVEFRKPGGTAALAKAPEQSHNTEAAGEAAPG